MRTIAVLFAVVCLVACGASPTKDKDPESTQVTEVAPTDDVDASAPVVAEDSGTTDSAVPVPEKDAAPPPPHNQATCIAACEVQYPKAADKSHQLDATCFLGGSCEPVCNHLKPGPLLEPTVVEGGCDTVAAKSYPITTTSQACSDCLSTTVTCCTQWTDIFGSTDGRALNACANKCFTDFNN